MLRSPNTENTLDAAYGTAAAWSAHVPLRHAALAQIGATLVVVLVALLLPAVALAIGGVIALAFLQGAIAAILGRGLGMDFWWLPINALFVPGLVWTLSFSFPPMFAFGAFCLLASLYWGVARTRVPLFLSSGATTRAVAELLPEERSFAFLDMGCGLAGFLTELARVRPLGHYHGVESAPVPFLLGRLRVLLGAPACLVTWGDFNDLDLSRYDIVYAYLSPAAMPDVWRKASTEMRPGTLLISNSFVVPGVPPTMTISTGIQGKSNLMLWRI